MTQAALLWTAFAVLAGCALVGLVLLQRDRSRLRGELEARHADLDHLRARVDGLAAARAPHRAEPVEFVITGLGVAAALDQPGVSTALDQPGVSTALDQPARIDGRLFADIVLRETVVKAAALTHGVRRALAPEVVWRVRGEVRRELKRVRRQRRADLKAARRDWEARQRESRLRSTTDGTTGAA